MKEITPVLLTGESGRRLWPLSRKSYPKQFSNLIGETTLFQQSAQRLSNSNTVNFAPIITLTNNNFRFIVGEQLQSVGIDPGPILIEPEAKNTAPAILAASMYAMSNNDDAIILVAPSDHRISDTPAFHKILLEAQNSLSEGKILTFGVTPTHPETGYGYLELSKEVNKNAFTVKRFIAKPDRRTAETFVYAGNFLWNSGIFMFRAKDIISAFKQHLSEMFQDVENALRDAKTDLDFIRMDANSWARCQDISIDYGIMEKMNNLITFPFSANWSNLDNWDAVWKEMDSDSSGVVTSNNAHAINCKNTLIRSESATQEIVGLGLKDIIAIAMPDAVLVAHKDKAQDVKKVVSELARKDIKQAEVFPKDYRPWGWFETLTTHARFQVKRIFVKPGGILSLQSHLHRSEHWVVVKGTAKVTIDDKMTIIGEGESAYIPLGATHRMENPGKLPMILIEVQTGSYFGEDDIVRYEDVYARK